MDILKVMAPKRAKKSQVSGSKPRQVKPKKRRTSKGQKTPSDEGSDDQFSTKQLTQRTFAKWKPLHKTTRDFLSQVMDSSISFVLARISSVSYNDMQDHLLGLKTQVMKRLGQIKAPGTRAVDYKNLEQIARSIEENLVKSSNKMEKLEREVLLYESLALQAEEDHEKYKGEVDEMEIQTEELHPLLQNIEDPVLNLPALPKAKNGLDLQTITSRVLPKSLTELTDILPNSINKDLQKFVEEILHYTEKLDTVA